MSFELPLDILICPECKQDTLTFHAFQVKEKNNHDGILLCGVCRNWFVVEDNILEFLKININKDRRAVFSHTYDKELHHLNLNGGKAENKSLSNETSQKKEQIEFFDQYSDHYPQESQNFWHAYYKMTIHEFNKKTKINSRILDLGCGTGLGAMPFLNETYSVIGIDLSREMIKKAIERIPENQEDRHFFLVADAEDLPFKRNTFDYCIGMGILHHVHNPRRAMQSVYHSLKSGGIYFGHENNKTFLRPLFDLLMKYFTLWKEEAGEEQLFSKEDIKSLCSDFTFTTRTHVFLPPHFFNLFSSPMAYQLLKYSDALFSLMPLLKNHGGTIVFEAKK